MSYCETQTHRGTIIRGTFHFHSLTHSLTPMCYDWDWGFFLYKKRSISIQDIIIYHHISCCYHHISLCIIFSIMIYHVSRRHMIYRYIIFFFPPCDIVRYHVDIMSRF